MAAYILMEILNQGKGSFLSYYHWFIKYVESMESKGSFGEELGLPDQVYEILKARFESYKNGKRLTLKELADIYRYSESGMQQTIAKKGLSVFYPLAKPWLERLSEEVTEKQFVVNTFLEPGSFSHYLALELLENEGLQLEQNETIFVKR